MKNLILKLNIAGYGICLLLILCMIACNSQDDENNLSERMDLHLGISCLPSSLQTYGIPGTGDENTIDNLRVLVFDQNSGALEENRHYGTMADPMPAMPANLNYSLHIGAKRILVIGNEPAALTAALDGLTDFSGLQALTMGDETTINDLPLRLPFCTTKDIILNPSALPANMHIILQRSVGKLQVRIAKDPDNLRTVNLVDIQLMNVPKNSRLIDGYPLTTPALANLPVQAIGINNMGNIPTSLSIDKPYVFENFGSTAPSKTLLRVRLTQDGIPMTGDVFLICGTDQANNYIEGVRRNTVSNMTLTVWGEHLKVTYSISDWDDENPWDKEAGKDDSNMIFLPWDDENPWDWDLPA